MSSPKSARATSFITARPSFASKVKLSELLDQNSLKIISEISELDVIVAGLILNIF